MYIYNFISIYHLFIFTCHLFAIIYYCFYLHLSFIFFSRFVIVFRFLFQLSRKRKHTSFIWKGGERKNPIFFSICVCLRVCVSQRSRRTCSRIVERGWIFSGARSRRRRYEEKSYFLLPGLGILLRGNVTSRVELHREKLLPLIPDRCFYCHYTGTVRA